MFLACANVSAAARPNSRTAVNVIKTKRRRPKDAISKLSMLVVFWINTFTIPLSRHLYVAPPILKLAVASGLIQLNCRTNSVQGGGPVPCAYRYYCLQV